MLKSFDEYVKLAEQAHGHICAGQILGIRMGLYGLRLLGLDDPWGAHRKRLIVFVEIDRCAADAISVVTGCRLGKRALKFVDYGKMAATFCDLHEDRAVRLVALESAKELARKLYPDLQKGQAELKAYRELADDQLFRVEWVHVNIPPEDLPGFKAPKAVCSVCGEAINFKREILAGDQVLCRACAGQAYYQKIGPSR